MNKKKWVFAVLDALITSLILYGTTIITLFSQNVEKFSDINEVAYATASIGAALSFLKGIHSYITTPPDDFKPEVAATQPPTQS